jgi:hypothetical protein
MPKLTDAEKVGLSDEELEALDGEEVGGEAGAGESADGAGDDEGVDGAVAASTTDDDDEDGPAPAGAEASATEGEAASQPAANTDAASTEVASGTEAATEDPVPLQPPPGAVIAVPEIGDYEAERGALLDSRKELRQKHRDGDISADEYDEQLDELNDKIALLDRRKSDHDNAIAQNQAVQNAQYQWTIEQVKKEFVSKDAIDYDKNPTLMAMWDQHVRALAKDEANANRQAEWFLREGHRMVKEEVAKVAASLGFSKADAPKPPAPPADKEKVAAAVKDRVKETKLKGVGEMPAASADSIADDEFSDIDNLSGLELERALAKMPEERANRYLNA